MIFTGAHTVLLQFLFMATGPLPAWVREAGTQTVRRENGSRLLDRNGASVTNVPGLLSKEGFRLVDCHVRQHIKRTAKKVPRRPSVLLTFVFKKSGVHSHATESAVLLARFARMRYEHVTVWKNAAPSGATHISVTAFTIARAATMLKTTTDRGAAMYGLVLTKSTHRRGHVYIRHAPPARAPQTKAVTPASPPTVQKKKPEESAPSPQNLPLVLPYKKWGWKVVKETPKSIGMRRRGANGKWEKMEIFIPSSPRAVPT